MASPWIQKFTGDGDFLAAWGSLGFDDGQFNSPVGVAVDAEGNVFVSDEGHHLQKFRLSVIASCDPENFTGRATAGLGQFPLRDVVV